MPAPGSKMERLLYVDNLRWLMIVLVVFIHANVIFGPVGQFFGYEDRSDDLGAQEIFMAIFSILVQAFFMGLLFLIAGYFLPNSLARKGNKKFIWDRFKRLAIPSFIFMFLIAPPIDYLLNAQDEMSFLEFGEKYYPNPIEWDSGPMWFAIALLIFSVAWTLTPSSWTFEQLKGPLTKKRVTILIAITTIGTFLVRVPFPVETDVWNMQLSFFTQYILLFIVGIIAYHNNWLSSLTKKDGRFYMIISVVSVFLILFPILIAGGALDENLDPYYGGLHWQAFGYALFEQIFGISVCLCMLVWWRERHNFQGWLAKKLSDNAFAVYVFHPPVVLGIAILLADYDLPVFVKFLIVAFSATVVTFSLADLVLRRIPGLKRVL